MTVFLFLNIVWCSDGVEGRGDGGHLECSIHLNAEGLNNGDTVRELLRIIGSDSNILCVYKYHNQMQFMIIPRPNRLYTK